MTARIPVTVLGATGVVGQRFVRRLVGHPLFEIAHLTASEKSAGLACRAAASWRLDGESWSGLGEHRIRSSDPDAAFSPVVFSALDAGPAREIEPSFAARGALVFSNAAAFRMDDDVPLLVPEVNPDHLGLLEAQRSRRGWPGGILTNPNCTTTVLVLALAPLHRAFGIEAVCMTSLQAVSGAGHPGVPSLDVLGNVVPFIPGEEEKVETETGKILGVIEAGRVRALAAPVSAACHRVPVLDGHTEAVGVKLRGDPSPEAVAEVLRAFRGEPQAAGLPSAPPVPVIVHDLPDRPQVRRDVETGGGMAIHVGRIRRCPVLGLKLSVLGHNTERGAAGGSILNAELAHSRGLIAP